MSRTFTVLSQHAGATRGRLLGLTLATLLAGCDQKLTRPQQSPVETPSSQPASVQETTPREQPSIDVVLAHLADRSRTDGNLIVGLKEPLALRGVARDGSVLPIAARLSAAQAIASEFNGLRVIHGVRNVVTRALPAGSAVDTLYRTAILLQGPFTRTTLEALLKFPSVDYVVPNYFGHLAGAAVTRNSASLAGTDGSCGTTSSESCAWGIDSVRAPRVWSQATGDGVTVGIVDSGFDLLASPYGTGVHPDFNFASSFANFAARHSDDPCANSSLACYWEQEFHGSGVLGILMGNRDGVAAVGVAPGPSGGANIAKAYWRNVGGQIGMTQFDQADAVETVSSMNQGARAPIGVTSVMFDDTVQANYQYLHDAFIRAANVYKVLWFVAANNNVVGTPVLVPGRFDEVLAVGMLWRSNGVLTRSSLSPTDDKLDLVAPGYDMVVSWNRNDGVHAPTARVTGSSYAAPLAAGVGRLALQAFPAWNSDSLRYWMLATARGFGSTTGYGAGMPDAVCLLNRITDCRRFSVNVSGPFDIILGNMGTWTANVNGGPGGTYGYRWERSTDGGATWMIVGGDSPTMSMYVYGNLNHTFYLRVTVTTSGGSAEMSPSYPVNAHK